MNLTAVPEVRAVTRGPPRPPPFRVPFPPEREWPQRNVLPMKGLSLYAEGIGKLPDTQLERVRLLELAKKDAAEKVRYLAKRLYEGQTLKRGRADME